MLSSGVIDIHYIELLLKMCDLVLCLLSFVFGPKSPMLSMSKDVSSTDFFVAGADEHAQFVVIRCIG